MKPQKSSAKKSIFFPVFFMSLAVLFFVALIYFKDSLVNLSSQLVKNQVSATQNSEGKSFVTTKFDYEHNNQPYEFSFLEFGAKGCSACTRMEKVMEEVNLNYPQVKVQFFNVMLPEAQSLMKYYGVVTIPTQILLDKRGKEFFRHNGYISAKELMQHVIKMQYK